MTNTLTNAFFQLANNSKILKGGKSKMEIKSRYEVIAELEKKKRDLIREREGLDEVQREEEKELKEMKRNVEDKEDDIKAFKETKSKRKETIKELIGSVDASLERLTKISKDK